MGLTWEPGNDKQTMYLVFVIKTRHNSVSCCNSKITQKEMSKLFLCHYLTIGWNVDWEGKNQKKKMMDFDYYEEYLTNILNKMLLWQCKEKQIFIQLTFADWWKIDHVKKDQGEKLIQTLICSKLPDWSWGFKKKECSAYYRILFTLQNIT